MTWTGRRSARAAGAVALGAVLTAGAAGCGASPDAAEVPFEDVVRAFDDLAPYGEGRSFLLHPRPGQGTATLPAFEPGDDGFQVVVRCLGSGEVGLDVAGEALPARDCSDGQVSVGRESAGGAAVAVTVVADRDARWVAAVASGSGTGS